MLRCTYIVLIHNDEDNILDLVNSLKKVDGNFRKEYIFVDDGSTDESLSILKLAVNDLPRTTIITQSNQGPAVSINKASNLATGDYIHFVEGCEVLHPESTSILLESCLNLGTQVALGKVVSHSFNEEKIKEKGQLIEKPVESILLGKSPDICRVGKSGTLVSRDLLEKVGKADNSVYSHNMSLSLRCAKNSKFSYIPAEISYIANARPLEDKQFVAYNNLKSIYNFANANEEFFSKLIPQLLKSLSHQM
ncbi:MAG: glycosyltransferase, partial [Rickettsiaceae bacterium]|nr:glycosyltransferase [Rickettsiaceae bacterium]